MKDISNYKWQEKRNKKNGITGIKKFPKNLVPGVFIELKKNFKDVDDAVNFSYYLEVYYGDSIIPDHPLEQEIVSIFCKPCWGSTVGTIIYKKGSIGIFLPRYTKVSKHNLSNYICFQDPNRRLKILPIIQVKLLSLNKDNLSYFDIEDIRKKINKEDIYHYEGDPSYINSVYNLMS